MLELAGVSAGYGRTTVCHEIDLTVPAGGAVAIIGHNGAGKSTLLRAAMGLLPATAGRIMFDGADVTRTRTHQRVRRGIGYVPQGQQVFPHLTTTENLRLAVGRKPDPDRRIAEALDLFPAIAPLGERRAGLLSGGQRQQLAIARALLTEPRLLILDEPTEGIQPNVVQQIEAVIGDLTRRGDLTVLLVEQHIGFALAIADRYYVLEAGRVTSTGAGGPGALGSVRAALTI